MSKHFSKDLDNYQQVIDKIMSCDKQSSEELHKFEEKIQDAYLFRAKIDGVHIVYAVSGNKIIFLRAFKNFKEYGKFLENKKAIRMMF
jgi:mRNA-degrading endonuclease RelE of RelBE toxin-antitoxin system